MGMDKLITLTRKIIISGLLTILAMATYAQVQDENTTAVPSGNKATFSVGADLVSRYIWRGTDYGNSPSVQPAVAFSVAGFKAGCWGAYGLGQYSKQINDSTVADMGHYAEFDFYVSYTWKNFTLSADDYFFPNPLNPNSGNKYFNFRKSTTGHTVEICLSWAGTEKFPLQLYAGTLVYGADKGKDSTGVYGTSADNNYSFVLYFDPQMVFLKYYIKSDLSLYRTEFTGIG